MYTMSLLNAWFEDVCSHNIGCMWYFPCPIVKILGASPILRWTIHPSIPKDYGHLVWYSSHDGLLPRSKKKKNAEKWYIALDPVICDVLKHLFAHLRTNVLLLYGVKENVRQHFFLVGEGVAT